MSATSNIIRLSPRRAQLASFEHAYAVALRIHGCTGRMQVILRTGDPVQPYRVVAHGGEQVGTVLALVA
jgi:hypothetical protein